MSTPPVDPKGYALLLIFVTVLAVLGLLVMFSG